jgi:hypothetical protein
MTHTPGPWHAQDMHIHAGRNGNCIAICASKHDARVGAAAPQMLAALEAIVEEARSTMLGLNGEGERGISVALLRHAATAIATARGGRKVNP